MSGVLTDYLEAAMEEAGYREMEDGTWSGRVSRCQGLVAFASTRGECEAELRSTLEEWVLLGLRLGHQIPVVGGVDLNVDVGGT